MLDTTRFTHTVAVGAHIVRNDKMLLVLRNAPPNVWAPPGGHLERNEHPEEGLLREVFEELRMKIEIAGISCVRTGLHNGIPILALFYHCSCDTEEYELVEEHSSAKWFSRGVLCAEFDRDPGVFGDPGDYLRTFDLAQERDRGQDA